MESATISIEVDADTARVFTAASTEERRKLQFLLGHRLRELTVGPARPLKDIMREIGMRAETPRLDHLDLASARFDPGKE